METRQIKSDFQVDDSRTVIGYALCFDTPSEDLGFIEVIHKGAVTEDTIKRSDVFAKLNHNDDKVLARSKNGDGSLLLEVDEKGLRYMFDAPNTATGDELLEYLKRGDLSASSFAFTVDDNDKSAQSWRKENGIIYRDIYKIERLYDVSPVFCPAYEATSCSKRFKEVQELSNEIDGKLDKLIEEIKSL